MLNFPNYESFIREHYEKTPWLGRRAVAMVYSWSDVNASLYGRDPSNGRIHLYDDGILPMDSYAELTNDCGLHRYRILKDRLYEHMARGATLILNRMDLKCPNIGSLTHRLGQFVGEKTVSNGYASFGGSGAFERHWDTHDVFAVQLIGRKKWTLFEPTLELPLPNQKSKGRKSECPEKPALETVLEAGDALYLPRGWWHRTESLPGEETFHVAVGIHVPKVVDYATWICGQVMSKYLVSRRSIKWEAEGMEIESFLERLRREMADSANIKRFKEAIAESAKQDTPFALERVLSSSDCIPSRTVFLNSPYRQLPSSGQLISNGFRIQIDEKSRVTLEKFLGDEYKSKENQSFTGRELRLLAELLAKDIVFSTQ